jgi:membrane peptidoglycan carboxypeptidase
VSPLELATAYTAFATLGDAVRPRLVLKVARADGEVLWEAGPSERRRVLDPAVAFLVTDVLREAVSRGTGTPARQALPADIPIAGKTGTTNDATDAWFVGYTPEVVAAVWIGFDQPRPITAAATGGRVAAPVWGRMMARLVEGRRAPRAWTAPPGVVSATVDSETGLVVADGCEAAFAYREVFLRRSVPAAACPGDMPMVAGEDDGDWEGSRDEDEGRRAREAYLEALREEIERRLRDHRRRVEEAEDARKDEEKRRKREQRRIERERRQLEEDLR